MFFETYWNIFFLASILMIMAGFWLFVSYYKHLLTLLLSLEVVVLGLFSMMMLSFHLVDSDYLLMVYLGFAVCEGSVGLGLLVSFVRMFGNDLYSNISCLWC